MKHSKFRAISRSCLWNGYDGSHSPLMEVFICFFVEFLLDFFSKILSKKLRFTQFTIDPKHARNFRSIHPTKHEISACENLNFHYWLKINKFMVIMKRIKRLNKGLLIVRKTITEILIDDGYKTPFSQHFPSFDSKKCKLACCMRLKIAWLLLYCKQF